MKENKQKILIFMVIGIIINNVQYERAENIQEFFKRIYAFLEDVTKRYQDKNVLIVAHGGVSIPVACFFNENIPEGSLVEAGLVLGNCQVASYTIHKKIK